MANRLSTIVTRTGDDGTTGLGDGSRTSKDDARIRVMGDVDELNASVGVLLAETLPEPVPADLLEIQHDLFDLGGELSIPGHRMLGEAQVARLDARLAHYNANLPRLAEFILPGGTRAAALAHVCRTVCRRAERSLVALAQACQPVDLRAAARQAKAEIHAMPAGLPGDLPAEAGGAKAGARSAKPGESEVVGAAARQYLNRLSDLLFVLARVLNRAGGGSDVLWNRGRN
jgi:cob(I)alamin adenosyltransferase